jgi:hypothetical protein
VVFVTSVVSGIERRQTVLENAAGIPMCLDNINRYSCLGSTYSQDLVNIGLKCGPAYTRRLATLAKRCIKNEEELRCG